MIAFARSSEPQPKLRLVPHLDRLTVWSASGRHTGTYLGFHVDELGAWLVLQERPGALPLYLDFKTIKRATRHCFGGKRHVSLT